MCVDCGAKMSRIKSQFSMSAGDLEHDEATASAFTIAGAIAGGAADSNDAFVLLTIKHATNLPAMNLDRKQSDPFCVIRYVDIERKTRTHDGTLDPTFNQHFFFKKVHEAPEEPVRSICFWVSTENGQRFILSLSLSRLTLCIFRFMGVNIVKSVLPRS